MPVASRVLSAALPRWFWCYLVIFLPHGKQVSVYGADAVGAKLAVVGMSFCMC